VVAGFQVVGGILNMTLTIRPFLDFHRKPLMPRYHVGFPVPIALDQPEVHPVIPCISRSGVQVTNDTYYLNIALIVQFRVTFRPTIKRVMPVFCWTFAAYLTHRAAGFDEVG
jgi:hypothetical protein